MTDPVTGPHRARDDGPATRLDDEAVAGPTPEPTAGLYAGPVSRPDKYRLIEAVGFGAQAKVWRVRVDLGAPGAGGVAALRMEPLTAADREHEEAFGRHGDLLQSLNGPGITRVREVFFGAAPHRPGSVPPDRQPAATTERPLLTHAYTVQDFMPGGTLSEWIGDNPDAPLSVRIRLLATPAAALDRAHRGEDTQVPVAHGDVKPGNIMLNEDGVGHLVDFGLARLVTGTGRVGWTPGYNAPELDGDPVPSVAADRYAFVATTAEVLLGQRLPLDAAGARLDLGALEAMLAAHPRTRFRPELAETVLSALTAPPERRPELSGWLASVRDGVRSTTMTAVGMAETLTRPLPAVAVPPPAATPAATLDAAPAVAATADGGSGPAPVPTGRRRPWRRPAVAAPLVVAALALTWGGGWAAGVLPGPDRPWEDPGVTQWEDPPTGDPGTEPTTATSRTTAGKRTTTVRRTTRRAQEPAPPHRTRRTTATTAPATTSADPSSSATGSVTDTAGPTDPTDTSVPTDTPTATPTGQTSPPQQGAAPTG